MKFFNLDCHISVIADLKEIFSKLNHSIDSWSISGHTWVFNEVPQSVEIINQQTWRSLDLDLADRFWNHYQDQLKKYDGFICTYPPTFSLLYEKSDKPIIIVCPIRYEYPFSESKEKWNYLNTYIRNGIDKGRIILIANNKYDQKYCEYFLGRDCKLIPSLCSYTKATWTGNNKKFLYSSKYDIMNIEGIKLNHFENLKSYIFRKLGKGRRAKTYIYNKSNIQKKTELHGYRFQDICDYNAIINIPYTSSTMSIFENYTSNIPMFFPSKSFLLELYSEHHKSTVLNEMSWNNLLKIQAHSIIEGNGKYDPNNFDDMDSISYWLEFADFYNVEWMPYLEYFDSWKHLADLLQSTNLFIVSENMSAFNEVRKQRIIELWKDSLDGL